jgi:hypothetical protein
VITKNQLWAGQGNTSEDGKAWSKRIFEAVKDTAGRNATEVAAELGVDEDLLVQLFGRVNEAADAV